MAALQSPLPRSDYPTLLPSYLTITDGPSQKICQNYGAKPVSRTIANQRRLSVDEYVDIGGHGVGIGASDHT